MPKSKTTSKKETKNEKAEEKAPVLTEAQPTAPIVKEAKAEPQKKISPPPAKTLEPLGSGQAYFEAPDGTILVGDETREQIWYRAGNNGKGMWINKMRGGGMR